MIIVVIDEPQGAYHGGDVAAPVFREIAEQILPELNVTPDMETKGGSELIARNSSSRRRRRFKQAVSKRAATRSDAAESCGEKFQWPREVKLFSPSPPSAAPLMPDLRGQSVRDVARMCAQLGLKLEARGEGRAMRQYPAAGAEVNSGQTVRVEFGRGN